MGCAFAICLEKKQHRDKLCSVSMKVDPSNSSFTRFGSFRQASISERLVDPQVLKPSHEPIPVNPVENPHAVARPHATDSMILRQTSFRGFNQLQNSPFKRQLSLRLNELPSTLARQQETYSNTSISENNNSGSTGLDNDGLEEILKKPDPALPTNSGVASSGGVTNNVEVLKNQLSHLYKVSEEMQAANAFKTEGEVLFIATGKCR